MTGFQGTVVTDHTSPSLPAYRALGANAKGKDNCCFVFEQCFVGTGHGIKAVWLNGNRELVNGVARNDFLVQGGCLLLDEEMRVEYRHMFTKTSERWPIDKLVEVMGAGGNNAVRIESTT